jgi:hypothetical protein
MYAILAIYAVVSAAAFAISRTTVPFSWKRMFCPIINSVTDITGNPWQIGLSGRGNISEFAVSDFVAAVLLTQAKSTDLVVGILTLWCVRKIRASYKTHRNTQTPGRDGSLL